MLAASNRQAAFPERGASLAPVAIKVAVAFRLPYARRLTAPVFLRFRQLRSAYKRQAEPLLRIYFAMVA